MHLSPSATQLLENRSARTGKRSPVRLLFGGIAHEKIRMNCSSVLSKNPPRTFRAFHGRSQPSRASSFKSAITFSLVAPTSNSTPETDRQEYFERPSAFNTGTRFGGTLAKLSSLPGGGNSASVSLSTMGANSACIGSTFFCVSRASCSTFCVNV